MISEVPLQPSNFLYRGPPDSQSLEFQLTSRQLSDFDTQLLLYALFKPWALSAVLQIPSPTSLNAPFTYPLNLPWDHSPIPLSQNG